MDTSELFHLLDLPGQRDAEFLADEQTVGIKPWIGLEYLALCYSPLQAFFLKRIVVRLLDSAKEFPGLNRVYAKLKISWSWIIPSIATSGLYRRSGQVFNNF